MKDSSFFQIQTLAAEEAGIMLHSGKAYFADIRLADLARSEGFNDTEALVERLRMTPRGALHRRVVESLLVHETRFFRDLHVFQLFRAHVVPDLVRRKQRRGDVTVWSAGCATGQEPYSLGMILKEDLPSTLRARVVGTDLSLGALQKAVAGVYTQMEINRGLPEEFRRRYCEPLSATDWRIREVLRPLFEFRDLNLVKDWGRLFDVDVVFLRNVLIYLTPAARRSLLARVAAILRPGGYLFLGGTEGPLMSEPDFQVIEQEKAWCYQKPFTPAGDGGP